MTNSITALESSRKQKTAAFSPVVDFLTVGGLSIIFLAMALFIRNLSGWTGEIFFAGLAYFLAFAINFPHFAHSYQLFYKGFFKNLRNHEYSASVRLRMFFAGFLIPAFIAIYLVASLTINPGSVGRLISVMFFFVGWHYAKQGYGVLITLSLFKKIYFSKIEKTILLINTYAIWLFTWASGQVFFFEEDYYGYKYQAIEIPGEWARSLGLVSLASTILVLVILLKMKFIDKRGLSLNGLTGYFTGSYLWLGFAHAHPAFAVLVPLFHSLQYNLFVYRLKINEMRDTQSSSRQKTYKYFLGFMIYGIFLGAVFMDWLPSWLDTQAQQAQAPALFLVGFLLFINIHHYFIDNAFWRKGNQYVQKYLFSFSWSVREPNKSD